MIFEINQFAEALPHIEKHILTERLGTLPYLNKVRDYAIDNNIIFGGGISIKLLLGGDLEHDDFVFHLYTEEAFKHANKLTNLLHGDDVLVGLRTVLWRKIYSIDVSDRTLIYLYDIDESRAAIAPLKKDWYDKTCQALVLPPEVQLIELYEQWYHPQWIDDWKEIGKDLTTLIEWSIKRIHGLKGGSIQSLYTNWLYEEKSPLGHEFISLKKESITNAVREEASVDGKVNRSAIFREIKKGSFSGGWVIVGDHAVEALVGNFATSIIQIIAMSREHVDLIVDIIRSQTSVHINTTYKRVGLYSDKRLVRTSVRVDNRELCYIYNYGEYQLVPFLTTDQCLVAHPRVLFRFYLIDIWFLKLAVAAKKLDQSYSQHRASQIFDILQTLKKDDRFDIRIPLTPAKWKGSYKDEIISDKIKRIKRKQFVPTYYPVEYLRMHGKLREI